MTLNYKSPCSLVILGSQQCTAYIALYFSLQTLLSLTSFGFLLQDLVSFSVKDGKRHLRINQGFSYFKANHSKLKENIIIHMCIHTYILKGLLSSRNSQMKTFNSCCKFNFNNFNIFWYSGEYDARARVLIRHISCLLRVSPQELEEFEETLGERLREGGEESE